MILENEEDILRWLATSGAASMAHPGGTLLGHLRRTAARLASWSATSSVVAAGLCHAAYGTDGFPASLMPVARRHTLVAVIGADAEAIVYAYGSLDRTHGIPGVDTPEASTLRDRFTRRLYEPTDELLQQLVDLSCANELDILFHGPKAMKREVARWLSRARRAARGAVVESIDEALRALDAKA